MRFEPGSLEDLENFDTVERLENFDILYEELAILDRVDPTWMKRYTRVLKGENGPIAFVAVILNGYGVGEVWALVSKQARLHRKTLFSEFRAVIDQTHRELDLHRLQAVVKLDFLKGHRFATKLGFCQEATLAHYFGPGRDGVMYAHIQLPGDRAA